MRSRLISANSTRNMLLKPRLGRRRWIGIWAPSKPLMRTPERAVWPLPPRPAVLPLPEPMPRPTRMRFLREPALSAISLSFIERSLFLEHDLDRKPVPTFRDHAPLLLLTYRRRCGRYGEPWRSCRELPGYPAVRQCGRSC